MPLLQMELNKIKGSRDALETVVLVVTTLKCIAITFGTFVLFMFFIINYVRYVSNAEPELASKYSTLAVQLFMSLSVLVVATGFSIVLANGMMKRNAELVKLYFFNSAATAFLLFSSAVALSMSTVKEYQESFGLAKTVIFVVVAVIFVPWLVLIHHMYKKFEKDATTAQQLIYASDNEELTQNND